MRANLPTVDEQIEMMVEAEDMRNESAPISSASPYLGGGYSQEDIDSILTKGSGFQDSKYRIYRQFQKQEDSKEAAATIFQTGEAVTSSLAARASP